jgi:hypothetical protein
MKPIRKLFVAALMLIFVACSNTNTNSNAGPSASGYWRTATTTNGYLWLNLSDNNGSVSGTTGVSTNSASLQISGSRSGTTLSLRVADSSGSIEFTGPVSGDTFSSTTTICITTCSSGPITFTRTAAATLSATASSQPLIEQIKKFIR